MTGEVVLDERTIQSIIVGIEMMIKNERSDMDAIKSKYDAIDTYDRLENGKDFVKMYGECVDDYGKLSNSVSEVSEALMDIRSIKRALRKTTIPVSIEKTIRSSIEYEIEILTEFREALSAQRGALMARLRYYNSCQYMQVDKVFGDKC
jgi:uncharacterized NAD-dependent epimerase/dehydratase family protein